MVRRQNKTKKKTCITKCMKNKPGKGIDIGDELLEEVKELEYIGKAITSENSMETNKSQNNKRVEKLV